MAFGIPNIERIVSDFLEGGTGITAIRNVEYDKNFLWLIDFAPDNKNDKIPAPFDGFFPASDVTFTNATIESHEVAMAQTTLKFPKSSVSKSMSITFYDDEQRTLMNWFTQWMDVDILNNGWAVSRLNDTHARVGSDGKTLGIGNVKPIRQIRIALLDAFRKTVTNKDYKIYPDGEFAFTGSQTSGPTQYTLNFIIVEQIGNGVPKSKSGFNFDDVKQLIGRFF